MAMFTFLYRENSPQAILEVAICQKSISRSNKATLEHSGLGMLIDESVLFWIESINYLYWQNDETASIGNKQAVVN